MDEISRRHRGESFVGDGVGVGGAPLALRPRDAAKALGIGQRKLWDLTAPRGSIRCARLGTAVVYPVEELKRWLAEQAGRGI